MKTIREILAEGHNNRSQQLANFITRIADDRLGAILKFVDNIKAIDESGSYTMSLYRDELSDRALSINWSDDDEFISLSYWNEYVASPNKPDKEILFETIESYDNMKPIITAVFDRLVSCKEDKKLLENVVFQDGILLKEVDVTNADDSFFDTIGKSFVFDKNKSKASIENKAAKARVLRAKQVKPERFADPEHIFDDIRSAVRNLNSPVSYPHGVLLCGPGGFGKSYNVEKALEEANLTPGKDWVKFRVRMSPPQIYLALMEHYNKIVIFDDCDDVLLNKTSSDLFKAALETGSVRTISWNKTQTLDTTSIISSIQSPADVPRVNMFINNLVKNDIARRLPSQFVFTGKIIFITNLPLAKVEEALITRCDTFDVTMRREDIGAAMRKNLEGMKIYAQNRVTGETVDIGTDLALKQEVLDYILSPEYQEHMNKYNMSLNNRFFQRAYTYAYRDRSSWKRLLNNLYY